MATAPCGDSVVNFETDVLVGMGYIYGGCAVPSGTVNAIQDDSTKNIELTLTVTQHGTCSLVWFKQFWFSIPRPPTDYSYIFKRTILFDTTSVMLLQ
jgi:hypothetical protein